MAHDARNDSRNTLRTNMHDKAHDDFARELADELAGIESICRNAQGDGPALCLYRVVSGLSPDVWQGLKRELELEAWGLAAPETFAPKSAPAHCHATLRRFLLCEMDRARQCQQPLALALIEPGSAHAEEDVFELVQAQLRSFDHISRLPGGVIAVVLSGTPLASAERSIGAMLRRIRQVCDPALTCSAGLIGYGGLAQLTEDALIQSADKALEDARRLGGNRLEVAPSADAVLASRETLVRASEKHFLFTGRKLPEPQGQE